MANETAEEITTFLRTTLMALLRSFLPATPANVHQIVLLLILRKRLRYTQLNVDTSRVFAPSTIAILCPCILPWKFAHRSPMFGRLRNDRLMFMCGELNAAVCH